MNRLVTLCAAVLMLSACGPLDVPASAPTAEATASQETSPARGKPSASGPRAIGEPVFASAPRAGEIGVGLDAVLRLTFLEPMDTTVTAAAIEISCACLAGPVPGTLDWSADATVATFRPEARLPHGAVLSWQVSRNALTARGDAFTQASTGDFRTLRLETRGLVPVAALDGVVDSTGWVSASGPLLVGDEGDGRFVAAFLTFDLGELDPATTRIVSAELTVHQTDIGGTPSELGALLLTSVDYGAELDAGDLVAHVTGEAAQLGEDSSIGIKTVPATAKVSDDFQHRADRGYRSQYQLSFERQTLGGVGSHLVWLSSSEQGAEGPMLTVTTEVP